MKHVSMSNNYVTLALIDTAGGERGQLGSTFVRYYRLLHLDFAASFKALPES